MMEIEPPGGRESRHLYVIGEGDGAVKIGRAEDPRRRLSDLQVSTPRELHLFHVAEDCGYLERDLHLAFADLHVRGEWFNFGDRDPVESVRSALERLRPMSVADRERWRRETTFGIDDPCADHDCSAWQAISLVAAAAEYLFEAHPDPYEYLEARGFAWHCILKAYPGRPRGSLKSSAVADHAA